MGIGIPLRLHRRHRHAPGLDPGTIIADPTAPKPVIRVMAYDADGVTESGVDDVASIQEYLDRWPVTWVNVSGLGDASVVRELGSLFGIHQLALEDVVNTHQRSKMEEYDHYIFFVARIIDGDNVVQTDQMSLFLGEKFVLTFQEHVNEGLDPVRKRIRENRGKIRREGPDYLAYSIIDAMVDGYFPRLDDISENLEDLENDVVKRPTSDTVKNIHGLKRDLLTIRRAVSPLREAVNSLIRDTGGRLSENTRLHLRDCYDHTVQILDLLESEREIAGGLLDVYLSSVSNRMNEIMKVLTVIATVFIPLTFLVGLYGMNFDYSVSWWNMPELHWRYGYPVVWVIMIVIAVVELIIFWRNGWLGSSKPPDDED